MGNNLRAKLKRVKAQVNHNVQTKIEASIAKSREVTPDSVTVNHDPYKREAIGDVAMTTGQDCNHPHVSSTSLCDGALKSTSQQIGL